MGAVAEYVYCDLADLDAVKGLFPKALDKMGGQIHILVNCAGIQRRSPSVDFAENDWDDVSCSIASTGPSFSLCDLGCDCWRATFIILPICPSYHALFHLTYAATIRFFPFILSLRPN